MRAIRYLLMGVTVLASVASSNAQDTVRIAVSVRNVVLMPYYFAKDKGYFEKEGLRAEIIQIRSNLQVAGVASGELDFMSGVGTAIDAMRKGAPLKPYSIARRFSPWSAAGRSNRRKIWKERRSAYQESDRRAITRRFGCCPKTAST